MLTPAIISLLFGLLLAQRFKVLVLIPVILLIILLSIGTAIVGRNPAATAALSGIIGIVGLQIGYLLGLGLHRVMALAHTSRSTELTNSSPSGRPAQRAAAVHGLPHGAQP